MKHVLLLCTFLSQLGSLLARDLDDCIRERGEPAVVGAAFTIRATDPITFSLLGVDRPVSAALAVPRDRFLVYYDNSRFRARVAGHLESIQKPDPRSYQVSTLFTPVFEKEVTLTVVHFDSQGRFVEEFQAHALMIYLFQKMTNLLYMGPSKTVPNKAPEPTPGSVTPRAVDPKSK